MGGRTVEVYTDVSIPPPPSNPTVGIFSEQLQIIYSIPIKNPNAWSSKRISDLELKAISEGIRVALSHLKEGDVLIIYNDNLPVVERLKKKPEEIPYKKVLNRKRVDIQVMWIPREQNKIADKLSRLLSPLNMRKKKNRFKWIKDKRGNVIGRRSKTGRIIPTGIFDD